MSNRGMRTIAGVRRNASLGLRIELDRQYDDKCVPQDRLVDFR